MSSALNVRKTVEDYLTLSTEELADAATLSSFMDLLVELDVREDKSYRHNLRKGIIRRYRASKRLRDDPVLFGLWIKQPRIFGLPRRPKIPDEALVAFFRATYPDPSKASRYFKRIEHLWKKDAPASEVLAFLQRRGLQDPSRSKGTVIDVKVEEPSEDASGNSSGNGKRGVDQGPRTPSLSKSVHVSNLPRDYVAGKKIGDFVALGGPVLSKKGNSVVLQLEGSG